MNTPAHLLIGAAAFSRARSTPVLLAAFLGALLPDASLYVMGGVSLFILQIPAQVVFDELYFSAAWQTVFAVDNSFVLWGLLLGIAMWRGHAWAVALCGAALLHLALDFPLHHDDGRPHFWPLSDWVFESPLSYWDRAHGAMWMAPFEALAAALAVLVLWARQVPLWARLATLPIIAMEIWVVRTWLFVFAT